MLSKRFVLVAIAAAALFFSVSCSKQKHPGFELVDDVYVQFHFRSESGISPQIADYVTVDLIYRLPDTVLFNSVDFGDPMVFPVIEPTFKGDLYAGLRLLQLGDSATFVFPADSFFIITAGYPALPDYVKKGSDMFFDVKLQNIQTPEQVAEEQRLLFKALRQDEVNSIAAYIAEKGITQAPTSSGLYVIQEKRGSGRLPVEGDMLRLHFSISLLNGEVLFTTDGMEPLEVEFGSDFDTKGFHEGIAFLRKGGMVKLIVPSDLAYDSIGIPQMLPPFTTLVYDLELIDLVTAAQLERERQEKAQAESRKAEQARKNEPGLIKKYLADHQYPDTPLPSGLYYFETEKGEGPKPEAGDLVEVHYTLYNIHGIPLQSSKEFGQTFEFQVGTGQVIRGWDEGLLLMNEGGKARFVIPSNLAYSDTSRGEDIPAYSPLVFDVELISVRK